MARGATAWDPAQYLRFANERLRPALDLLAQVPLDAPDHVVDLGCGAGNVTAILKQRFPGAAVLGVDGSASMLEKARATAPDCTFALADIPSWQPSVPPDLIYSNAALQWVGGHATLFRGPDKSSGAFQSLSPAVLGLHQRLKAVFDPLGILNRGRLYADF